MTKVKQPFETIGSLKNIHLLVNKNKELINQHIKISL